MIKKNYSKVLGDFIVAHRDFVARRGVNKKKGKNKNILIGMMIAVVFAFGIGRLFPEK